MELSILYAIQEYRTPLGDNLMVLLSALGNKGFIWVAIAGVMICFEKTRKWGFAVLLSVAIGLLLGDGILKPLFARPRPFYLDTAIVLNIKKPGGYAFPSGHTLSAFAGAYAIFTGNRKAGIPALIVAVMIGFSRMYLFVHYPTDVLAGAILGVYVARLITHILQIRYTHPKCCKSRSFPGQQ